MKQLTQTKHHAFSWAWSILLIAATTMTLGACTFDEEGLAQYQCEDDPDCASFGAGYFCRAGYCQSENITQCTSDSQCDDDLFCNGIERCSPDNEGAGLDGCVAGLEVDPDDGIPCTEDSCDDSLGEVVNDATACECESDAQCARPDQGACIVAICTTMRTCETEPAPNGTACNDGTSCTLGDACDGAGQCAGTPSNEACDNDIFCDGEEVCDPGSALSNGEGCVSGVAPNVDDGIPCTIDSCDEEADAAAHDTSNCECAVPGQACPNSDASACERRTCNDTFACEVVPSEEGDSCNDGFTCTIDDACDAEGQCRGTAINSRCSNGVFCDGEEICSPQSPDAATSGCLDTPPPVIDDSNPCTTDSCDEVNDMVVNTPGDGCVTCNNNSECIPANAEDINPCVDYVCNPAQICAISFKDQVEACDDGFSCTQNDTCNGGGACLGTDTPALCDNGVFCDGAEQCNPRAANADAEGCVAGQPAIVDDGVDCTTDACDPELDVATHTPTDACECQQDNDCDQTCLEGTCSNVDFTCSRVPSAPDTPCNDGDNCTVGDTCNGNGTCQPGDVRDPEVCDCIEDSDCPFSPPCQTGASCVEGACITTFADAEVTCSTGVTCDVSSCDGQGACTEDFNDNLCGAAAECMVNICSPAGQGADLDGCVPSPADNGTACTGGACQAGVCVPDATFPEGPMGDPNGSCNDGQDNDEDGLVDANDPDCGAPSTLTMTSPGTANAGLGGADGAMITLNPDNLSQQQRHLYCQARPILLSQDMTANTAEITLVQDINEDVNPGTDVVFNNALGAARGVRICNGYGVKIEAQDLNAIPAGKSVMVSMTMANPVTNGLGNNYRLVASYKHDQTDGKFIPMVILDQNETNELKTYEFMLYNNNYGMLELRFDVIDTNVLAEDSTSCGFVEQVSVFQIANPGLSPADGHRDLMQFLVNGSLIDSSNDLEDNNPTLGTFFSSARRSNPIAALRYLAAAGYNGRGVDWAGPRNEDSYLSLPSMELSSSVAGADTGDVVRDRYRVNPLVLDFGYAFDGRDWNNGDLAHMVIGDSTVEQKLASAIPETNRPGFLTSHYDVPLKSENRFFVVLPESMRPLTDRTLSFTHTAIHNKSVYIDNINLYSFNRVYGTDVEASVAVDQSALIKSATAGPVRVQCFWQNLDDPNTTTVASDPATITFQ